jgi:NAD(P)-dependent dehydrogenase (short-subunit alcohol dehydrogenase family)
MDLGLEGRVALVTGAGSGIGLATTRALLAEGARVVAADLDPSAAAAGAPADRLLPFAIDLATADGGPSAVAAAIGQLGTIDILVNNVGVCPHRDGFLEVDDQAWRELLELNFFSMVRCCRAAIPRMLEQGRAARSSACRLTPGTCRSPTSSTTRSPRA